MNSLLIDREVMVKHSFASARTINPEAPQSKTHPDFQDPKSTKIRQLEGECRIQSVAFLKINYVRGVVLSVLIGLSVFGLLLLKYYRSLRALTFYDQVTSDQINLATHIFVRGGDKNDEICLIVSKELNQKKSKTFTFKHLQYEITDIDQIPLAFDYNHQLDHLLSQEYIQKGLSYQQARQREDYYGRNQHSVEVPNYFEYLFDVMTKPFFIIQYLFATIYILKSLRLFGVMLIFFSWMTTTINYILLRRNFYRIKSSAQRQFTVRVLRNGQFSYVKNTDLVPGDLYHPENQIPCDSILLKGSLFVNQASLTGEDVPISKVQLTEFQNTDSDCHWIFEGSAIQTVKQNALAVAINVGFGSRRGRIIRKILTKSPKQPQFFSKLIYFLLQVLLVATIIYFATLRHVLSTKIESIMVVLRLFDFIAYSFPVSYPIFFNLFYSFCLTRLSQSGIMGMQPEKTVQSGRVKTICFDKTGTLTQNKMKLDKVFSIHHDKIVQLDSQLEHRQMILDLFSCCNSVESVNGQPKGDEIDLQMFMFSQAQIKSSTDHSIIRSVKRGERSIDVIRINQYQSKFQSMSVLARININKLARYFIFSKGNPELIYSYSQTNNHNFLDLVKSLSLEGYRTIAFGYREVAQCEIQSLLKQDRNCFLLKTKILGLVTFSNSLFNDAKETIQNLSKNYISTKIITGDNIYLGIQTAFLTQMIPPNSTIAILEGKNCKSSNQVILTKLHRQHTGHFTQTSQKIDDFQFREEQDLVYAIDNHYINMNRYHFMHDKVKVFARITPQNKALIVRKHREIYHQSKQSRTFLQSIFGECEFKVAMVGDGANDLIAIKEADIGIGIAQADAVYSSSFAIKNLSQISEIIRQSKNTQRQIIDLVQYFGVVELLSIIHLLVLTEDATFPTSIQLIYKKFANILTVALFLGFSKPAAQMTKYFTATNFMGLENHLVFWGNTIIYALGLAASYSYYSHTSDFQPNPYPEVTYAKGFYGKTKSATIVFLCSNVIYTFYGVLIFRSKPWKQPFYKNKPLAIVTLVNIIVSLMMFFKTSELSFLNLKPINKVQAGFVLLIMLLTVLISALFNFILQELALHKGKGLKRHAAADGTQL